jgi:glycosyltransferase involved in cell wall biosynthesis
MQIVSATISGSREGEISDAIRSVVDRVDKVLLVDTGINDKTLERAKDVAGDKLVVAKHTWTNFSNARNASIDEAKNIGADWILIVDTDERIHFGQVDLRAALESTSSEVMLVESTDGHYPKEKIIRSTTACRYVGPTHEALLGGSRETLRGVTFSELGKSVDQLHQKFARDAELLEDYLVTHADDPRWWYYLGSSFEGLTARARAAEAYGRCVERRKYGDEAAWAGYKQAEMLYMLGHYEAAMAAAGRGLGAHPMYAECAWMAAVSASRLGRIDQAIAWARIAVTVGRYKGCGTERSWFRHLPALYELPFDVLRYTLPEGSEERKQAEEDFHKAKLMRVGAKEPHDLELLSISREVTQNRGEIRNMLRPPMLEKVCPSARTVRIDFEPPSGWHAMNPTLCMMKGKTWCVVRTVNYTLDGRSYDVNDPARIVRTKNYLGTLTEDGKLENPRLIEDLDKSPRQFSFITGYEDIRLVAIKGKLVGSATVCDRDPNRRQIARLYFTEDGDIENAPVQASRQWHEKNWMPFVLAGNLAWIHSLDPTVVISAPGVERSSPFALEHLRGGAVIPYKGGYLAVTHETIESNEKRIYLHRFVKIDKHFTVYAVSPSWAFHHHGIEFCAGMVLDREELVLSYGVQDREAWVARVSVEEVESMKWITKFACAEMP